MTATASSLVLTRRSALEMTALAALLALLAFAFQGSRPLYDADEGRYTNIAINMLESGDFAIPRLDPDHPHFDKPPMTYWLIAASFDVFGINTWAARLPNALAFVGIGLLLAWMAGRIGLRHPARVGWIWGMTLAPALAANIVNSDTLLTFFETLAVAGFVAAETEPEPRIAKLHRILMWCGFGLAFLTKGPPGLIPLAAIGAVVIGRDGVRGLALLASLPGMLLALVLGLGWFAYVAARVPGLAQHLLGQEFVGRIFTDVHERNPGLMGILRVYLPMALVGTLPWTPLLFNKRMRARLGSRRHASGEVLARRLAGAWGLIGGAIFLLAQSRLPLYVLPLFVPLALWLAVALDDADPFAGRRATLIGMWFTGLIAFKAFAAVFPTPHDGRAFAMQLQKLTRGQPVSDWIFVDSKPRFDVHLYTGRMPEIATLSRAHSPFAAADSLCIEVAESQNPAVLIDRTRAAQVRAALQRCSASFEYVGDADRYAVFIVRHPGAQPVATSDAGGDPARRLFGNHQRGARGIAAGDRRHDAGVDYAQ